MGGTRNVSTGLALDGAVVIVIPQDEDDSSVLA